MDDTLGIVGVILQCKTPGTKTPIRDGMGLVALDMDKLSILDMELNTTPYRMVSRRRPRTCPEDR
jgi:hypothetical protein